MKVYIDAAFMVHEDMKSHSCLVLIFGKGFTLESYRKQKLITHSSTDLDLFAVDDLFEWFCVRIYF